MKKFFTVSLIIMALMLSACSQTQPNDSPSDSQDSQQTTSEPPIMMNAPTRDTASFIVYSYDQLATLWGQFNMAETDESNPYGPWYSDDFTALVNKIQSDKSFLVPMLDGKQVPLRDEPGLPVITVFPSETYYRPWVFYHCTIDGVTTRICTMYLDGIDVEITENMTASEFLKEFFPSAPNLHNKEDNPYIEIYEEEISYNHSTVKALIYDTNDSDDSDRTSAFILQDELLIALYSHQAEFEADWTDDLSFVSYPLPTE